MPGKLKGRVSDASLVCCGGYANKFGATVTTGRGESIMKMGLAKEVVTNMETGEQNAQVWYKLMHHNWLILISSFFNSFFLPIF